MEKEKRFVVKMTAVIFIDVSAVDQTAALNMAAEVAQRPEVNFNQPDGLRLELSDDVEAAEFDELW